MLYPKEAEIVNILRGAVAYSNLYNLIAIRTRINEMLLSNGHPFTCSSSIGLQLTETNSIEFSYYIESVDPQYEHISGIMVI